MSHDVPCYHFNFVFLASVKSSTLLKIVLAAISLT